MYLPKSTYYRINYEVGMYYILLVSVDDPEVSQL